MDELYLRLEMKRLQAGFTIVELLVVIVVIGILAAITIVAYNGITAKAQRSSVVASLSQNNTLIESSLANTGSFPANQAAANLNPGSGITLAYTPQSTRNGYCLQASGWGNTYYSTSNNAQPTAGSCPSGTPTVLGAAGITNSTDSSQANTLTVPSPSSVPANNLLLMIVFAEYPPGATAPTLTVPSFFNQAASSTFYEDNRTNAQDYSEFMNVYYGYAPTANASSYSVTFPYTNQGADEACAAVVAISGGASSGNPFGDTFVEAHKYGYPGSWGYSLTTPALTPGGDNSLVLSFIGTAAGVVNNGGYGSGTIMDLPSSWTRQWGLTSSNNNFCGAASFSQSTSALINPLTFTAENSTDSSAVLINSVRPY